MGTRTPPVCQAQVNSPDRVDRGLVGNGSGDYYGWPADAFLADHGSIKLC